MCMHTTCIYIIIIYKFLNNNKNLYLILEYNCMYYARFWLI